MRFFAWFKQLIKNQYFYLTLIILLSIFFRFWQLSQRASFEFDQEATAWAAKQLLVDHKPILLGMKTSSGDIFIGPLYFYLYAIPMIFTHLNPVGQMFLSSLIGVGTTILFYFVGQKIFSSGVGLIASFFHAISLLFSNIERPIWNVTGAFPIFLLIYYCYYKIGNGAKRYWLYLLALIGLGLNFHLTTVFFIPVTLLFLIYLFFVNRKVNYKDFYYLFLGLVAFFLLLSPLFIFDFRHNFLNSKNIITFFFAGGGVNYDFLIKITHIFNDEITVLTSFLQLPILIASIVLLTSFFVFLRTQKSFFVLNIFLFLTATFGFSLFKGQITSYYYLLLYPMVVFGISLLLFQLVRIKKIFLAPLFIYLGFLLAVNTRSFLGKTTSFSLSTKQKVVEYILTQAHGKPYYVSTSIDKARNFGFSYLFWLTGRPPSSTLIKPVYTIVIPFDYGGIKPDFKIDDIGLVMPKKD